MKEKDERLIEGLNLEQLITFGELLHLEEHDGKDVSEARDKVRETINKKFKDEEQNSDLYPNATDGELENLHFQMSRLAEEGHDFLEDMQTIENKLIRRSEEPNRYENRTREELKDSLTRAQIREEQGLGMTETIIKIEKALEEKVDSGIIYKAE